MNIHRVQVAAAVRVGVGGSHKVRTEHGVAMLLFFSSWKVFKASGSSRTQVYRETAQHTCDCGGCLASGPIQTNEFRHVVHTRKSSSYQPSHSRLTISLAARHCPRSTSDSCHFLHQCVVLWPQHENSGYILTDVSAAVTGLCM